MILPEEAGAIDFRFPLPRGQVIELVQYSQCGGQYFKEKKTMATQVQAIAVWRGSSAPNRTLCTTFVGTLHSKEESR